MVVGLSHIYYSCYEELIVFGWFYWEDEFLKWLRRYTLLKLSMNMNVSFGGVLVCSTMIRSAYNFALRISGYQVGEQRY